MMRPSIPNLVSPAMFLAVACLAVACGDSGPPTVDTTIPVGVEVTPGVRISVTPGAIRSDRADVPVVWTTAPDATLAVTTDHRGSSDASVTLANLPPETSVTTSEITYRAESDAAGCDRVAPRTVDCRTDDDPLCRRSDLDTSGSPTRAELTPDLPECVRVTYDIDGSFSVDSSTTVALVGATDTAESLPGLVDRAASREADLAILLGDHLETSSDDRLRGMAADLANLSIPIVVTAGERERISGSLSPFRRQFGPPNFDWQIGDIQFLAVESATGSFGEEGIDTLGDRIREREDDRPLVVVTHTPPLDPKGLRDRGFRSRVEGARALSVLTDEKVDLLTAGHVADPTTERYDGLEMVLPPEASMGKMSLVELVARDDAAGELGVEVERVSR